MKEEIFEVALADEAKLKEARGEFVLFRMEFCIISPLVHCS